MVQGERQWDRMPHRVIHFNSSRLDMVLPIGMGRECDRSKTAHLSQLISLLKLPHSKEKLRQVSRCMGGGGCALFLFHQNIAKSYGSPKSHLLPFECFKVYVYGSELVVLFQPLSTIFSLLEKRSCQVVCEIYKYGLPDQKETYYHITMCSHLSNLTLIYH